MNLDLAGILVTVNNVRGNPTLTVTAGTYTHVLYDNHVTTPFAFCRNVSNGTSVIHPTGFDDKDWFGLDW